MNFIESWNAIVWVIANVLIAYVAVGVLVFVLLYVILFDPKATTVGKYVFRFFVSLLLIVGLVFIGVFIDPSVDHQWFQYPSDATLWRPTLRLIGFGYAAFTITGLSVLLVIRRFYPDKLRTDLDREIFRTRKEEHDDVL